MVEQRSTSAWILRVFRSVWKVRTGKPVQLEQGRNVDRKVVKLIEECFVEYRTKLHELHNKDSKLRLDAQLIIRSGEDIPKSACDVSDVRVPKSYMRRFFKKSRVLTQFPDETLKGLAGMLLRIICLVVRQWIIHSEKNHYKRLTISNCLDFKRKLDVF